MCEREQKKLSISIDDDDICILHNENGTRIFKNSNQLIDSMWNTGQSLDDHHQQWKLTQIEHILDTYNSLIKNSDIMKMVQYILSSSSALTLNILKHSKEEIELNNQLVERLKIFMSMIEFISQYHKDKNDFLRKWKNILDIITFLADFKENTSKKQVCEDLYPRTEEGDFKIQENQCFGSIVFIHSNSTFSFKKQENCIGLGITNKKCFSSSESHSSIPIHVVGSSLVRVVYPSNDRVDERGMFVILNKNQEENTGIGEIISFGDLATRETNSYHLVGVCSLDKTDHSNSLFLFSTSSHTSRITHPSNDFGICFVLMLSLPPSYSLLQMLLQNTPSAVSKKL